MAITEFTLPGQGTNLQTQMGLPQQTGQAPPAPTGGLAGILAQLGAMNSGGAVSPLPEGVTYSSLNPIEKYRTLVDNAEQWNQYFGDPATYREVLKQAAEEAANAKSTDELTTNYRNALAQSDAFNRSDEELAAIIGRTRGNVDDWLFGINPDDANWRQGFFRNAIGWNPFSEGGISSDAANVSAAIGQIIDSAALENYDRLRGAGSISNAEVAMGKSAANTISKRGTTPEEIVRQLRVIETMISMAEWRNGNGVTVDEDNNEWMVDANGNRTRVVTTRNPQTGQITAIPLNDPSVNMISAPFNLSNKEFEDNYYNNVADGTWIIRNGEAFIKGSDNDPVKTRK